MSGLLIKVWKLIQMIPGVCRNSVNSWREVPFIRHNRKVWGDFRVVAPSGEILVELFGMASSIVAFSYLGNLLAKKHNARIKAYSRNVGKPGSRPKRRSIHRVYESFNSDEVLFFNLSTSQMRDVERLFDKLYPQLKTKKDVENLRVESLWIGDLLYDSHLMNAGVPTVEIAGVKFQESLRRSLECYVYWRDYFNSHNVKAVIVSHCVYNHAIILRLAIHRSIAAYQITAVHVHYLTKKNLWAYDEFLYYPEEFLKLPAEKQEKGKLEARKRLKKRFAGEVGVDMSYSTKSAYARNERRHVLQESHRIKVFVVLHCFFDSPHPYGVNLFPDFYEWLTFLGEISEKTDYDWYMKTHPDFRPGNIPIVETFLEKYPKFRLLPSDTSHLDVIDDGIDFVLTVYGTVGFEYAALGVPVINASMCNPHIRYNFNIHPRTVAEYEAILMNLADQTLAIDINEIYEYYYMRFINNTDNYLFDDYHGFLEKSGGYASQVGPVSYQQFLEEFNNQKHDRIMRNLNSFIDSEEFFFSSKFLTHKKVDK